MDGMSSLRQQLIDKCLRDERITGAVLASNPGMFSAMTDGFDYLLLVVSHSAEREAWPLHYIKEGSRIQERWVTPLMLEQWMINGTYKGFAHWITAGEILMDRDMYLSGLRQSVLEVPQQIKERKLLYEFSKFLRSYLYGKQYAQAGHLLDAYNHLLEAIHHWARIAIVQAGMHPETTVWSHVKTINPGVYKLYEELTVSDETLKQRIELVVLACEFSVMSKMKTCCDPLIKLLASREEAWSLQELAENDILTDVRDDLSLLLGKLVKRLLAREVVHTDDKEAEVLELRYTV